jgi:hypothetical protein
MWISGPPLLHTCYLEVSSVILFILNVHVPAEYKSDDKKDFYEELQFVFNQFPLHNMTMLGSKAVNSTSGNVLEEKLCAVSRTQILSVKHM